MARSIFREARAGTCRLCLRFAVLRRSHLLPAALSRWMRIETSRNPHPVWVTGGRAVQMAYEVADYLLCEDCEQRFHRRGENWVLRNAYRGASRYRLQEAIRNSTPYAVLPNVAVYKGGTIPLIAIDQLIYFAASIFWRAGAHQWKLLDHRKQIELGPYQEELRRFLLDEGPFPQHAALWVNISTAASPTMTCVYPYGGRFQNFYQHRSAIPGLAFWLHLGRAMPPTIRFLCAAHSSERFLCYSDLVEESAFRDMGRLIDTAGRLRNPA